MTPSSVVPWPPRSLLLHLCLPSRDFPVPTQLLVERTQLLVVDNVDVTIFMSRDENLLLTSNTVEFIGMSQEKKTAILTTLHPGCSIGGPWPPGGP